MYICKFGGSSLSTYDNILKVVDIIISKKCKLIVVFSAIGKTTDKLIQLGKKAENKDDTYTDLINELKLEIYQIVEKLSIIEIKKDIEKEFDKIKDICKGIYYLKDFNKKTCDYLTSFGELLTNFIIFKYLEKVSDKKVKMIDSTDYIVTDNNFGSANIIEEKTKEKIEKLKYLEYDYLIIPGFIGKNELNNITTLGRGGGDYTAAIFGSYLDVDFVEIWTDVDGIRTSDPRIVKNTDTLDNISYNEMLELSHYGANVIYTPTILPLYKKNIPLYVRNTFNPEFKGTKIDFSNDNIDKIATAVSSIENVTLIKIYGNYLIGKVGFSGNLFSLFSNYNINIIMISQSSSEHSIYLVINQNDYKLVKIELEKNYIKQIDNKEMYIDFYNDKSILSIETNKLENIVNISSKIYPIFKKYKIDIYTQITSDHNICLVLDRVNLKPIQVLVHDEIFFKEKSINILLLGYGLVGKELVNQFNKLKNINIVCIANSKKLIYNENGINLDEINLENGDNYILEDIIEKFVKCKLFNKVFIDCTSSELIYSKYQYLLNNFISVVTPNKKANTTNYNFFKTITSYPNYKYETTVGAGLPIIDSIKNIMNNGDNIIKVEGILSGTLSYIFNEFSKTNKSFLEIVKNAKKLGFTEPNPKDDLNGMDVVRKILIISRLIGLNLEISDIDNKKFISNECLNSNDENDFFKHLENCQESLQNMKNNAIKNNKIIKHVAVIENKKVSVSLKEFDCNHPFNSLDGSDNMLIITSNNYNENKLIIRGPGAGASVTAAGIISDVYLSL